ncbi:hypothetical protein VNO80_22039 [Phaseolus coccineus]|uniref:Uncharacterized protein n=1 Tax=Phaseolus coccineus TaxID=3886 RepID=A0AAN9QTL9_PHACN
MNLFPEDASAAGSPPHRLRLPWKSSFASPERSSTSSIRNRVELACGEFSVICLRWGRQRSCRVRAHRGRDPMAAGEGRHRREIRRFALLLVSPRGGGRGSAQRLSMPSNWQPKPLSDLVDKGLLLPDDTTFLLPLVSMCLEYAWFTALGGLLLFDLGFGVVANIAIGSWDPGLERVPNMPTSVVIGCFVEFPALVGQQIYFRPRKLI